MVTLGKAFPTRQQVTGWSFALAHALAVGRRVWSQQGLQDGTALAVAAFRVYAPPCPCCRFARSTGSLVQALALVTYASRAEPGSYRGRSRERPRALDVQAMPCRGSRWALESRLMLSPLPMVVTAQKPSDVPPFRGFRFWTVAKACRHHIAPNTGTRKSHATRSVKLTADKWALSETEPGCRDAEGGTKRA